MSDAPSPYEMALQRLEATPRRWLVTGAAGFIGSHLVEQLLRRGQHVVGLDNFATGTRANVEAVLASVGAAPARRLRFIEGDIRDPGACKDACAGVDIVLHQAALGSVPRSIRDPMTSHDVNVTGFLRILEAARDARAGRVVYASSSSVYGDHPTLPKVEHTVGRQLSPYAVTKYAGELYANVFRGCYDVEVVGLRYFNVFGPRQDPHGPYAAVIPIWFSRLLRGQAVEINGDGETSRDFCFVANAVQANVLAAVTERADALGQVFNVACGQRTTLNELFRMLRDEVSRMAPAAAAVEPVHREFRAGDVRHSLADIDLARTLLGYRVTHHVREGIAIAAPAYRAMLAVPEPHEP